MSNTVADFVFTQYTVEYDMKPVEYMNGENFTENRGGIAATPPGAVHWTYRHTYILELAGRLAPERPGWVPVVSG